MFFLLQNSGEVNNKLLDLVSKLLDEQIESILTTGGLGLKFPHTINSVISYEACRGILLLNNYYFNII